MGHLIQLPTSITPTDLGKVTVPEITPKSVTGFKILSDSIIMLDESFGESSLGTLPTTIPADYLCYVDASYWNSSTRKIQTLGTKSVTLGEVTSGTVKVVDNTLTCSQSNDKNITYNGSSFGIGYGDFTNFIVVKLNWKYCVDGLRESFYSGKGENRWFLTFDLQGAQFGNSYKGLGWIQVSASGSGATKIHGDTANIVSGGTYIGCITRKSGVITYYINGISQGSTTHTQTLNVTSYSQICLNVSPNYLYCSAIYNRALTETEIKGLNSWAEKKFNIKLTSL